ncbi:hypothetical protein ABEX47_00330 [Paenibacillus ehimensis]|uniref:hypothetical protein n=1 Tax=Paenibacillus ehimensis TaxID=79264 RepID=UPI002DB8C142|nr:hypothetical protein [Paenibacillus ehimensis]MEC0214097.1 hypothetical protein [Paenibacillus ehimensis]
MRSALPPRPDMSRYSTNQSSSGVSGMDTPSSSSTRVLSSLRQSNRYTPSA